MGNGPNICGDPTVMYAHNEYIIDFLSETPLFNVEDIKFPLSTKGIKIVDARGRRVKLAGGNWSGGHMCRHCVDGLEFRKLRDIAMDIRYKFKMNCIRLTYSLQLFFENKPVPAKYLTANPDLLGKTSMEIFDFTVKTLTDVGLMVILNNHTSTSQWCCSNDDGDGLWWSRQFPQHMFFQNAEAFAHRYKDNPRVIGSDLRNELRKAHGLTATWGDNNPLTDWKRAAKICADKVQKIAPHWLILVSGLDYQLDLTQVHNSPLILSIPNKLIYTGHFYDFSWVSPQVISWNLVSYDQFKQKLFNTQTSVRALGYPYFLGQFGNNQQNIPWKYLMQYLKETDIDWTYWALDGFKCDPSEDETFGVFTNNFAEARHPEMLEDLVAVGPPAGTKIIRPEENKSQDNRINHQVYNQPQQYQQQQEYVRPELKQQMFVQPEPTRYNQNQQQYQSKPEQKIHLVQKERGNQGYSYNQEQYLQGPPQNQNIGQIIGQGFLGGPSQEQNNHHHNQNRVESANSPPQNYPNKLGNNPNTGNIQNWPGFPQNTDKKTF